MLKRYCDICFELIERYEYSTIQLIESSGKRRKIIEVCHRCRNEIIDFIEGLKDSKIQD